MTWSGRSSISPAPTVGRSGRPMDRRLSSPRRWERPARRRTTRDWRSCQRMVAHLDPYAFDENPSSELWNSAGIYFSGLQKTTSHLFLLNPANGTFRKLTHPDSIMAGGFTFTSDGRRIAFSTASPETLNEVYVSDVG